MGGLDSDGSRSASHILAVSQNRNKPIASFGFPDALPLLMIAIPDSPLPRASLLATPTHKRPRGLWKGRRTSADPRLVTFTHEGHYTQGEDGDNRYDADSSYYDDLDDTRSSSSSGSKRRRISGAFSDDFSPQSGAVSRALSPDLYHAANSWHSYGLKNSKMGKSTKATSSTCVSPQQGLPQTLVSDMEDWENLKELFTRASDMCEADETLEALPLLRAVIRECNRILSKYPDPSVVFARRREEHSTHSPVQVVTPTEERLHRDWGNDTFDSVFKANVLQQKCPRWRSDDLPTAFHAIFGISLFLMGNIIAQDPSLALSGEPSSATTYWLAALDVFESGENLPCFIDGHGTTEASEDWRMAIAWGRTLVSLADEKVSSERRASAETETRSASSPSSPFTNPWGLLSSPGPFSITEPTWPKDSPFYTIAQNRPPVTRRMSMYSASAHDILTLATDQFSRGIFHMPHPHHSYTPHPTHDAAFGSTPFAETSPPPLTSPESSSSTSSSSSSSIPNSTSYFLPHGPALPPTFSRPKELFTIASEVLGVAERLSSVSHREYWAKWADSVFNQMRMEADIDVWRGPVTRARGRCWLVMASARAEEIEEALERGESGILGSEEAEEAREGLGQAISFFERAKGSATTLMDEDAEDVSPLLAEALLTLANLTVDENKREELYCRAQVEGGEQIARELQSLGLGLPAPSSSSDTVMMDVS